MNFEIVRLSDFSGKKATIYSVIQEDEDLTLFDHFIEENENEYPDEILDIVKRIKAIGMLQAQELTFSKIKKVFQVMGYVLCMTIPIAIFGCIVFDTAIVP